jgi:DNA-binding CsgD family transcriptional regulator
MWTILRPGRVALLCQMTYPGLIPGGVACVVRGAADELGGCPLNGADFFHRGPGSALVGRDGDLQLIWDFLRHAGDHGDCLIILGEPGIGKTALLDAAAETAAADGARVLRAGGVQFEAELSYSGLHQLLLPLHEDFCLLGGAHRDALNVALGFGVGQAPSRLVVSSATLTLVQSAAKAGPVLMVVDDLPWLDRASLAVLGFVARRVAGGRIGFLATSRTGEESFFDRSGLPEHELAPLQPDAASELMQARFPALAPLVRDRILAEAQGNPLAVLELPTALSGPERAALRALPPVLPLTRRLRGLFASRITEMPAATQRLLLLIALDGQGDLRILGQGGAHSVGVQDLVPAEQAGLAYLDTSTRRLTFRHPLIRAVVVDMATVQARRSAHAALAELAADQPDRRAWHLVEAAIEPDEHVAGLLEQAGHRILRRGDAVGAVAAFARAAELSPQSVERGRRLAEAAYVGAEAAGNLKQASQLLAETDELDPDPIRSLRAASAAAWLVFAADGDMETAHRLLVAAIEQATRGENAHPPSLDGALHTLLLLNLQSGRADLWEPFHHALDRLGPDAPLALELCAATLSDPLRTAPAVLDRLDAAIEALAGESDPAQILQIAHAGVFVDRLGGCRGPLLRVERDARQGGAVIFLINALSILGYDDFWSGQWDGAKQKFDEALELSVTYSHGTGATPGRHMGALIAAARGDYDTTQALTDQMLQWATPRQVGAIQYQAWAARALAALGRGDFEEAYQQASKVSPPGDLVSHNPQVLWCTLDLVEAAIRSGHQTEAARHARAVQESGMAALSSRLALVTAGVTAMATTDDSALGLFEAALAIPGAHRWQYDMARVRLAYGERLRRAHAFVESRSQLRSALDIFERLGAQPWADRAAQELRATGQSRSRAYVSAHEPLTPQEREVAELAAAGLTNKQIGARLFLSHRTVGAHLHSAYRKLGITARAALRDALADPVDSPGP